MIRSISEPAASAVVPQADWNAHPSSARGHRNTTTVPRQRRWIKCNNRRVMLLRSIVFGVAIFIAGQAAAASDREAPAVQNTIAVLDFELHDLTLTPGIAAERERTASIGPMLRQILKTEYGFELATIASDTQNAADLGAGYLFEHHDVAAELGREAASDWVVVGRVHKASFLFVYFKALIIDTRTQQPVEELVVEVKGTQERLTRKGVESLAEQISAAIRTM